MARTGRAALLGPPAIEKASCAQTMRRKHCLMRSSDVSECAIDTLPLRGKAGDGLVWPAARKHLEGVTILTFHAARRRSSGFPLKKLFTKAEMRLPMM